MTPATAIILTCPWHRRDAVSLSQQLRVPIFVPHPEPLDPEPVQGTLYGAGDTLPSGATAYPGLESNDLVLWIPAHAAIVAGDTLIERDAKLTIPVDWINTDKNSAENVVGELQPLLALPVELVLPTHGNAFGPDDLRAVLA